MKKLFMLLALVMMCATSWAKAPDVTDVSAVGEGIGNGGHPLLTVTCAAKKADKVQDDNFKLCALRTVLFKGWTDKSKSSNYESSTSHPSLCGGPDAETANADYFADFFGSGEALKYADVVADTRKVMKSGKLYHVSQMVNVNIPELRKKLEKDNIIKSLRSGW